MKEDNKIIFLNVDQALDHFNKQCANHISALIYKINAYSEPDCVYHYTNEAGLLGILKGDYTSYRHLWSK